ncbi:hypothetical protein [Halomonas sp. DN3]|uniref:hypothetical protein n=1 Tax=Halomonas sp. DN3 TaxID=2953657 RepID=UPI00209EE1F4|nr:hypothetical protein [Halomonas sp. DN3]USZ50189.1 hypothetical protein NKF27_01310 [Halomonas sp. DN3]
MTPLWKAYRFTRREQHAAEAARSRESLIQILDRARDEDVSLNPRPSSTILALGLLCLLLGTLGFIITLAGGLSWPWLIPLALVGAALLGFDWHATERVAAFLRLLVRRAAELDFRLAEPDVDLDAMLTTLRRKITDFQRTYADNGELEYCRRAADERVGGEYWVYRFSYDEGMDKDRRTYHRNGLICDLFEVAAVDLCNPREGKWRLLHHGSTGERWGEGAFSRYFVACTAEHDALAAFLTDDVVDCLVRLARSYPELNVQVTRDHLLCLTWSGEDPYARLFEPVSVAPAARRAPFTSSQAPGEDPDEVYRALERRLRAPRHLTALEPLLNAIEDIRAELPVSSARTEANIPLRRRLEESTC